MPRHFDPEGVVLRHLRDYADLSDTNVLDVGCGDGYLTWRYAGFPRRVTGIDTQADRLAQAVGVWPSARSANVTFARASAERLPFPPETFHQVIFGASL